MDALSISAVGMAAASQRFAVSASRAVNADADPVSQAVEQIEAVTAFKASAAVFKTADKMLGGLLDLTV